MRRIDIDSRSNGGSSCAVCCCEPIDLRAGATELLTLAYANWTIPIMANGGPGLVPGAEFAVEENAEFCSNGEIEGFGPPQTTGQYFVTNQDLALNGTLTVDLSTDVAPAGNTFEFALHPVSGPYNGSLTATPESGTSWVYKPNPGFVGYDQFWVEITDGQGRKIIRPININVGAATGNPPPYWGENRSMGVQIDRGRARYNRAMQTIDLPIYMPPSNDGDTIDACRKYRITVKAYAQDCDNQYSHLTCIDVRSGKC